MGTEAPAPRILSDLALCISYAPLYLTVQGILYNKTAGKQSTFLNSVSSSSKLWNLRRSQGNLIHSWLAGSPGGQVLQLVSEAGAVMWD